MNAPTELPLRDIHLPAEPGWWPPAPGWWVLAMLVIVVAVWILRIALRSWRASRERRRVLSAFDRLASSRMPASAEDAVAILARVSEFLRRWTLRHRPQAARLSGDDWLQFLDGGDASRPFSTGDGRLFADGPYQRAADPEQVVRACALARRRIAGWSR